jgi:hypothetical protein
MGQHLPSTTTAQHIEDRVDYFPHSGGAGSPARLGGRDQWFDVLTFCIAQVTGVSLPLLTHSAL